MDYNMKSSNAHKEKESRKILEFGMDGNCSKIPIAMKIARPRSAGIFDGAVGISVAGRQTNIAIPNLDVTLDAGINAEKVLERNLVISHFDADHVEGIGRAMCNAVNRKSKLDIFLPSMKDHPQIKESIKKFKKSDKLHLIKMHEMVENETESMQKDRRITTFKVHHAPESLGYVISVKEKDGWKQKLTYTGDVDPGKMNMNIPEILESETVVIDGSLTGSLLSFLEPIISSFTNHASTGDITNLLKNENGKIKNVGIIHLPMIGCNSIKEDFENSFDKENEDIFFLQSCRKGFDDPLNRMTSFAKI